MTASAKYATCKSCNQEMNGAACTFATYEIGGVTYDRIPMGPFSWAPEIRDCNDCNTQVGGLHHPCCDMEECPRCHQQAIACGCVEMLRFTS